MKHFLTDISPSRLGCLAGIAMTLLVAGYAALTMIHKARNAPPAFYQAAPALERSTVQLNGATYQIPGATAYIDGRNFGVDPPVTAMRISLWDTPSELIEIAVMHHGDEVTLIDHRQLPDGRTFARVSYGGFSGWVEAKYLSPERTKPVDRQISGE